MGPPLKDHLNSPGDVYQSLLLPGSLVLLNSPNKSIQAFSAIVTGMRRSLAEMNSVSRYFCKAKERLFLCKEAGTIFIRID